MTLLGVVHLFVAADGIQGAFMVFNTSKLLIHKSS